MCNKKLEDGVTMMKEGLVSKKNSYFCGILRVEVEKIVDKSVLNNYGLIRVSLKDFPK